MPSSLNYLVIMIKNYVLFIFQSHFADILCWTIIPIKYVEVCSYKVTQCENIQRIWIL